MSENTSNFSHLYKSNEIHNNQLDRRDRILEELKQRRNDEVDKLRGITDIFDENTDTEEPLDAVRYRKKGKNYGGKLMLSEWLTEIPCDLEDEWLFKTCPVGIRNIIVAHNGVTTAYNRKNMVKATFQSGLPGGEQNSKSRQFTLLDCIYRNKEKTFYVLDILVWGSYSLLKCSSEFRFFFLKSKFEENPELNCASNKFNFVVVDCHVPISHVIETSFNDDYIVNDQQLPVDGVLFYHKHCTYMSGFTPLVGWLKPYMLPEKLQIPVSASYMLKKPKGYINLENYLDEVQRKYKKKKDVNMDEMETEDSVDSNDMDE